MARTSMPAGRQRVTLTFDIDRRGQVSLVAGQAFNTPSAVREGASTLTATTPPVQSYANRKAFNATFLGSGAAAVQLPKLSPALAKQVAPLLKPEPGNAFVLKCANYSVAMHAARRLAIYSAPNVDFAGRYDMPRPPDVWKTDPRIVEAQQLTGDYCVAMVAVAALRSPLRSSPVL